jgi:hypothetical protein
LISIFVPVGIATSAELWSPNFETLDGNLEYHQALLRRHPDIMSTNLAFNHNPLSLVKRVPMVLRLLGDNAASMTVINEPLIKVQYSSLGEFGFNAAAMAEVKKTLLNDIKTISSELEGFGKPINGIATDSRTISNRAAWLRLIPFLYDSDGQSIYSNPNDIVPEIELLTPSELDNRYGDLFKNHQTKYLPHNKLVTAALNQFRNQFEKKIHAAVTPTHKVKSAGMRNTLKSLTLEKVPAAMSIQRGTWGGDCSGTTVPYYSLVKDTDTYWIHKGSDISGYALVSKVKMGDQTLPYIITINGGTLDVSDTRAVIEGVSHLYQSNGKVILPDVEKTPHFVNTGPIGAGMTYEKTDRVSIQMPKGWDEVSKFQDRHGGGQNYYKASYMTEALFVDLAQNSEARPKSIQFNAVQNLSPYLPTADMGLLSTKERALLAGFFFNAQAENDDVIPVLQKKLQLNNEQVISASRVLGVYVNKPDTESIVKAVKDIGLTLDDVADMHFRIAALSLRRIHDEYSVIATPEKWKAVSERVAKKIDERLQNLTYNKGDLELFIEAHKTQLPYLEGKEKIWEKFRKALRGDGWANALHDLRGATDFPEDIWTEILAHFPGKPSLLNEILEVLEEQKEWPKEVWDKISEIKKSKNETVIRHLDQIMEARALRGWSLSEKNPCVEKFRETIEILKKVYRKD